VQAFAAEVDSWRGGKQVDVLLNNAALGSVTVERYVQADYLGDSKKESMKRRALEDEALMRVNALGPLWVTEALIDFMGCDKDRSAVLFIGSVGGGSQSVFPGMSGLGGHEEFHSGGFTGYEWRTNSLPYTLVGFRPADAMSKAAVAHAVKLLAATHVHDEIDFMCVNPGATLTDMFKASTLDRMSEEERLSFTKRMPKSRLIAPSEIAEAVYWLATSPAARIFHGACFDASQGLAVRPGLLTELLNPC
jgi:NAD(P)-dependent dehydrogenase (short-subunit alcohol dehydrogenase family)